MLRSGLHYSNNILASKLAASRVCRSGAAAARGSGWGGAPTQPAGVLAVPATTYIGCHSRLLLTLLLLSAAAVVDTLLLLLLLLLLHTAAGTGYVLMCADCLTIQRSRVLFIFKNTTEC